MNLSGPPGIPELIPRGGGQIINIGRGGTITVGRHSLPGAMGGGGQVGAVNKGGMPQQVNNNPAARRPAGGGTPGGKLMRLRCRFRPLHDAYIKNGVIIEDDADVIFVCGDGHQLKAHKVIMASSSKFFAKIFEDQTNQVAVVSVPDVKVDVMKLILQLTYRDRVILTMRQIKEVGEFITIFGMAWTQFGYEEYSGEEPMSSLPMPPVPMKPVELPRTIMLNSARPSPHHPNQQQQQQQQQLPHHPQQQHSQQIRKVYNGPGARAALQQNFANNGNEEDDDGSQMQMGQQQQMNERHSRKSRLTPRAGTEGEGIVEQDEEDDPENLIQVWMSKLGKRDSVSSTSATAPTGGGAPGAAKRMREDNTQPPPKSGSGCSVCGQQFKTETALRWHEERHVGHRMFKCKFCDELNNTPKECWVHERDTHGFTGLNFQTPTPQPQTQQQQQQQQPQSSLQNNNVPRPIPIAYPRYTNSPGQQLSKRIKMSTMKKIQAQKKKPAGGIVSKLSQIGIGDSNGAEQLDLKKLKQLHWLYVCERCENCADSATKATVHYTRCFPNKEKNFEDTVTKYRQGFYGKSNCPLCPRRYPQNSGFMIHCGHQHQQYRKLFTHIGGADDQLKCNNCKEKFSEPMAFHEHLETDEDGTFYCAEESGDDAVPEAPPVLSKPVHATRSSTEGKATRPRPPRRAESPMESKASYKVQFHTPPKSARLASRVQAEASAEAAKAKATDINFPPVDCPVCGDSDLPNISDHLRTKHKDLNVDVTRIAAELLRCKGCTITFDICDLLDHKNCLNQKQEESATASPEDLDESNSSTSTGGAQQRRSSSSSTATTPAAATSKPTKPAPIVVDMDSLPPGVGRSPIEKIEMDDLLSIQAIRSALKCLICGKTAKKLGAIADCLRGHGIHRCSLCFNSYCSKNDYALHLKKCHGSGSNKLKCPLCPKSFANAGQTSGHMYSTHWLQILRQNEQAMKEEEENEASDSKEEEGKGKPTVGGKDSAEDAQNDGDADANMDQDDERNVGEEDDNQASVSGVVEPPQEEEEDDDDEARMEIDESVQPDDANE